jgi:ubiquitin carboxyl-terminal hydrolase 34
MITYVATGVDSIDSSGGQEHIAFFLSLCQTSNERINLNADALAQIVFTMLPTWAPTLLIDRNESVRQSMHSILGAWVFQDRNEDARSESSEETGEADHSPESDNSIQKRRPVIGRALVRASIDRLKASFVKDPPRHVDGRQVEIIISVMKYCLDKYFTGSEEDQQTLTEAKSMFKCCCFILAPQ